MSDTFNLGHAELVRLQGTDSRAFAQAQFCSDITALSADDWQWSGWLDAKGRVRYFFALIDGGEQGLLAWLPLGNASAFAQELGRYLFRSKLTVEALNGWAQQGVFDAPPCSPRLHREGESFVLLIGGIRSRLLKLEPGIAEDRDPAALARWRGCDAADGLPLIDDACAGQFVPQALDLERWGAVSFRKGCYPGQEVAARLHFRGGNKRVLRQLRWHRDDVQPTAGAEVTQTDAPASVGALLYAGGDDQGAVGLAVLINAEISDEVSIDPSVAARIELPVALVKPLL